MKSGFTLIEMIVVMAIGVVLITATTVNLLGGQRRVVKASGAEQLVAEIRGEQMRAMMGGGTVTLDLTTVDLDNNLTITTTFPGSQVVFAPISGEVVGENTVTITDTTDGTTKTLHMNSYGVVTQID